jgi:hypothetical protein
MMPDGATVKHVPLINVLGGVPNELPVLFEIKDCTEHMQEGGKKNRIFAFTSEVLMGIRRDSYCT